MAPSQKQTTDVSLIKVISWPRLWMHWPVYLALARTQKQFGGKVQIALEPSNDEVVTDEKIRRRFYDRAQQGEPVFALCEPGPEQLVVFEKTVLGADGRGRPPAIVRRLPVVLRQPHWLLWRESSEVAPGAKVWAYPVGTTSGNFVQTLFYVLPRLRDKHCTFEPLENDMKEQRDRVEHLRSGQHVVAAFTPWHLILNPGYEADGGNKARRLHSWTLPGPARDVTALLIPDVAAEWTHRQGTSIADAVGRHLRHVFSELGETYGDRDLMDIFLRDNCPAVNEFLGVHDESLNDSFLCRVLCEYVRLGCYFPYRIVDSAVSAEVQRRIRIRFDGLKHEVLAAIQLDLNEFLGSASEWRTLSFRDRIRVWTEASNPPDKGPLWQYLTHLRAPETNVGIENILRGISVRTALGTGRVPLVSLAPRLPLQCSLYDGDDHGARFAACQDEKKQSGEVSPNDPRLDEADCLTCVVSGVPRAVLRPAAVALAKGLGWRVKYRLGGTPETDPRVLFHTPCPLCVDDLAGMIDVFVSEKRDPPASADTVPCELVVFNGFNGHDWKAGGSICVGIFSRGSTEGHKGSGNAQYRFQVWANQQESLGHSIEFLGFWWGDGQERPFRHNPPPNRTTASPYDNPVTARARKVFQSEGFTFGYVSVFRIDPVENAA